MSESGIAQPTFPLARIIKNRAVEINIFIDIFMGRVVVVV